MPYDIWEKKAFFTTEGNVVHYGFIEQFIEDLGTKYNIKEIAGPLGCGADESEPYGYGFHCRSPSAGYKDMSPPTKD